MDRCRLRVELAAESGAAMVRGGLEIDVARYRAQETRLAAARAAGQHDDLGGLREAFYRLEAGMAERFEAAGNTRQRDAGGGEPALYDA